MDSEALERANGYINKSLAAGSIVEAQEYRKLAVDELSALVDAIDRTRYLLLTDRYTTERETFLQAVFTLGTLYKTYVETDILITKGYTAEHTTFFRNAIKYFRLMKSVTIVNDLADTQLVSVYTQLSFYHQSNLAECLAISQESIFWVPDNPTLHYNLAFTLHKLNRLEPSCLHYKIALALKPDNSLILSVYNGLAGVYRSIAQWPEALYYLQQAEKVNGEDPDIQNQLGVVYTEMRRTDLAEGCYNKGIQHYTKAQITPDPKTLLSDLYLNLGHMHSYNGDNKRAVESYNKSLKINPKFRLPFQNKLMNLSYIFNELPDGYILKQHKLINRLFRSTPLQSWPKKGDKVHIGFVSGDFVNHPVSFFISSFLKHYDRTKFKVTCYSECVVQMGTTLTLKIIKNKSADEVAKEIQNDGVDILVDLSGHTALNRLDVFALKPARVQITYIGYPYSTGLDQMDYRITDATCEDTNITQEMYTEKLVTLPGCFLCYTPVCTPKLGSESPYLRSGRRVFTIGCYNRLNKINDHVIDLVNDITSAIDVVQFVFKTKALLNEHVAQSFLGKFKHRDKIRILDCTVCHTTHVESYNDIDIALDTFPYSGTTTSCEALLMGVPVVTLYDNVKYFHAQNVTTSILINSKLSEFVCYTTGQVVKCILDITEREDSYFSSLKGEIRDKFLNGEVCNGKLHTGRLEAVFRNLKNEKDVM
ncbi:hypothetical protein EB118_17950 [bacterium]|nr:hypothetical protein [bacterium]NDD84897.1 hypothetical protein [bacterium]NDG31944.1 hypothetical protein [bacterium]